jgi:hypothetical protein
VKERKGRKEVKEGREKGRERTYAQSVRRHFIDANKLEEGRKEGRNEGRKEGRKEGREGGRKEGRKEGKRGKRGENRKEGG